MCERDDLEERWLEVEWWEVWDLWEEEERWEETEADMAYSLVASDQSGDIVTPFVYNDYWRGVEECRNAVAL